MALDNTPDASEPATPQLHIERGTQVLASDGASIGTVHQIVMDRDTGVLRSLVVKSAEDGREYEIATDYVEPSRDAGAVRLTSGGRRVFNNADIAKPYVPEQYVPVEEEEAVDHDIAARETIETKQPVVTDIEQDAATVMLPPQEPGTQTQGEQTSPPDHAAASPAAAPSGQTVPPEPAPALASIVADDISGEGVPVAEAGPDSGQETTLDAATTPLPSEGVAVIVPAMALPPILLVEGTAPASLSPTPESTLSPVPDGGHPFSKADISDIMASIASAGQPGAIVPTSTELPARGETSPSSTVQPAALYSPEDEPTPALPRPLLIGIGALALTGGIVLFVILRARRQRQRTLLDRVNARADDMTTNVILGAGALSRNLSKATKNVTSTAQTLAGTAATRASELSQRGQALAAQGRDLATTRAGDLTTRSADLATLAARAKELAAARAGDLAKQGQTLTQQTKDTAASATSSLRDAAAKAQPSLGSRFAWFRRGAQAGSAAQSLADAALAAANEPGSQAMEPAPIGNGYASAGQVEAPEEVVTVGPERIRLKLPFGRYRLQPLTDDGDSENDDD